MRTSESKGHEQRYDSSAVLDLKFLLRTRRKTDRNFKSTALARRRGRLRRLCLGRALLIERDEIDGVEEERRKAAIAHRGGDDLARERKQQPRAFDHDERL